MGLVRHIANLLFPRRRSPKLPSEQWCSNDEVHDGRESVGIVVCPDYLV